MVGSTQTKGHSYTSLERRWGEADPGQRSIDGEGQLEEDDDDLLGSITMLLTLTEVSHTGSSPFLGLPLPLFFDTISSSRTPSVSTTRGEG